MSRIICPGPHAGVDSHYVGGTSLLNIRFSKLSCSPYGFLSTAPVFSRVRQYFLKNVVRTRHERHTVTDTRIQTDWNRLPSTVKQWLIDNPGCMILPRTLSTEINAATEEPATEDPHGEIVLNQQDLDFIRMKSREAEAGVGTGQPGPVPEFFDSVQQETPPQEPHSRPAENPRPAGNPVR
jgi:hypothetical protein